MESPDNRMINSKDYKKRAGSVVKAVDKYCPRCCTKMVDKGMYWECPKCLEAIVK